MQSKVDIYLDNAFLKCFEPSTITSVLSEVNCNMLHIIHVFYALSKKMKSALKYFQKEILIKYQTIFQTENLVELH